MAETLGLSVRLLVVRYLVFTAAQAETMARGNAGVNAGRSVVRAVVQALMRKRVNAGALCLTGAASYALAPPVLFRLSLLRAVER